MLKLGYTIVYVASVEETVAFYEKAFGLRPRFIHESKCYGELETGVAILAFAEENFATENITSFTRNSSEGTPAGFEIAFVSDNVKKYYQKAIENGAKSIQSPVIKPWGQEVAYVFDCNNVIVEICSPMGE